MEDSLPRLKKTTLVDDFIKRFEEMILSGKLAIGEKLPSERDLAIKLGVSRPVVHEGLINLATKGFITRTPSGGAVINDYRKEGSLNILTSILNFHEGTLEPHLAQSILELRELIEVENARLAAKNRTDDQLASLQAIHARELAGGITQPLTIAELDFSFHHQISLATNNIFYPLLLNSFKSLYLTGAVLFFSDPQMQQETYAFHTQLVAAIARKDESQAVEIMKNMLKHGMAHYFTLIDFTQ